MVRRSKSWSIFSYFFLSPFNSFFALTETTAWIVWNMHWMVGLRFDEFTVGISWKRQKKNRFNSFFCLQMCEIEIFLILHSKIIHRNLKKKKKNALNKPLNGMGIGSATNDRATLGSNRIIHMGRTLFSSIHYLFTCTQEFNNLAAILIFTWSCTKSLPFFLYSNEHLNYCFRFSFGRVAWHGIAWLFLCFFFFFVIHSTLQFNSFSFSVKWSRGWKKSVRITHFFVLA